MNKYFLELKEDSTPNKRVKVRDTGATEEPLLSEMSHKFRIKKVIVRKLEASNFTIINIVPLSVPNSANDSISFAGRVINGRLAKDFRILRQLCWR